MVEYKIVKESLSNLKNILVLISIVLGVISLLFYDLPNFMTSLLLVLVPLTIIGSSELLINILMTMFDKNVSISRIVNEYYMESHELEVKIVIDNRSKITFNEVELCDEYIGEGSVDRKCITIDIPPRKTITVKYGIPCSIGKYVFNKIIANIKDTWGIIKRTKNLEQKSVVKVIPKIIRIHELALGIGGLPYATISGSKRMDIRGLSMDFIGHREYVIGDPAKIIDWKASARRGQLIVKEYSASTYGRLLLILLTSTKLFKEKKYPLVAREIASIAYLSSIRGIDTSIIILTPCTRIYLPYGNGKEHALNILKLFGEVLWPTRDLGYCNEDYMEHLEKYVKELIDKGSCRVIVYMDNGVSPSYLDVIKKYIFRLKGVELSIRVVEV